MIAAPCTILAAMDRTHGATSCPLARATPFTYLALGMLAIPNAHPHIALRARNDGH
jgi:hypothetical protein